MLPSVSSRQLMIERIARAAATDRRQFLRGCLGLALGAFASPLLYAADKRLRFIDHPFKLGVASGVGAHDRVVLWTRLCPDPLHGGGMPEERVRLRWEVASDEGFGDIVRKGDAYAVGELGHSVHAEVDGLAPDRPYWYRFFAGDETSPTGRTRTLPAPDAANARLRFALASCQHFEQGYFGAYRHLVRDEPDLMIFVGDYIYESSWGDDPVREHATPEPHSLLDYRDRHAQYRGDETLQAAHAALPWLVTVDDHEVDNDWAGDVSEGLDPQFVARRANALQAYFEHMPLPMSALKKGAALSLYRRLDVGRLARIHLLDDRQYRDAHVCARPGIGGANTVSVRECPALDDPSRTLLGREQERWLDEGLRDSRARWNVIAQETLFSQFKQPQGGEDRFYSEDWNGYRAARGRLVQSLQKHKINNALIVGGDVHTSFAADVKADFDKPDSAIVATEFTGTSLTSAGLPQAKIDEYLKANPHMHLGNSDEHGYLLFDLAADETRAKFRVVESIKRRDSPIRTLAEFRAEHGKPGVKPV